MNKSPGPPEHFYLQFQEWRSLNKGTPKQRTAEWKKKAVCRNCEKKDTLNLTAQNQSSIMMTQTRKTTILSKTSQERKNLKKKKSVQFANTNKSTGEDC